MPRKSLHEVAQNMAEQLSYKNPERVVCTFTYEELDEISESLKFTRRNDPDADQDFNEGLNKHVRHIMKRVRQNNPGLSLENQNNPE